LVAWAQGAREVGEETHRIEADGLFPDSVDLSMSPPSRRDDPGNNCASGAECRAVLVGCHRPKRLVRILKRGRLLVSTCHEEAPMLTAPR